MKKRFTACLTALIIATAASWAQPGYDVFQTITKYLIKGDADALAAWFAKDIDISVISGGGDASKAQAKQILKNFFEAYTPQSFTVIHTAGRANMKYVFGELSAGGETFNVTVFLSSKEDRNEIQQIKIYR
ncbi:MAG: DUF4783 domain-containing protein [Bacteroidales bacterium]|nr:DUF4783 domain-containing protein [Bacteroidales bacterium]